MKKMVFESMKDLKDMITVFEQHNIDYSWYFLNRRYEIHLGSTNPDHVKMLLKGIGNKIKFKWDNYYW